MSTQGTLNIGTSGWHYDHWIGTFYPEDTKKEAFLPYYAERFRAVELNNSFYNLPKPETFEHWRDTVPDDFGFAVKASRYITHMKKLKEPVEALDRFLSVTEKLGGKLDVVLFQLPPRWKVNSERLASFLDLLPDDRRYAFEFRDTSWFTGNVYSLLTEKNAAFCIYELAGTLSPKEVTADFVYIRLHGPGDAYQGSYDTETLSGWAGACSTWLDDGKDVYCFFDNDQLGYAAQNALSLQSMLEGR